MNTILARARFAYVALLSLLVFAPAAHPQVEQGRVVGRVTDAQNAVVAGATVRLTNLDTNIVQTATSDSSGNYVITPVPAGNYGISVSAPGFAKATIGHFELQVGQIAREDIALQVGSAATTVEVTASSTPLLNTESATVGHVVTNQQLTGLPLNGRGFYQLAQLTPGASLQAATGNSLAIR